MHLAEAGLETVLYVEKLSLIKAEFTVAQVIRQRTVSLYCQKRLRAKKLSEATAKKLLTSGKSGVLKGFKSKAGKSFSAALILKDGKIEFDFNQKAPVKRKAKRRPVKQNPTG